MQKKLTAEINETPEIMLKKLFGDMLNLSAKLAYLKIDPGRVKNFYNFMRKVYLSMDTYDKYVIAVAGLQGVGKTFFLRHYLKLDDKWLKDTNERGECYPVLVLTDPDISEPRGEIRKLVYENGLMKLQTQEASPDDFFRAITSGLDNMTLLPVLRVPHVTQFPHIGFLLLPGYERSKTDWQDLMCHAMLSAEFPIVVTDSQALASDGSKAIREDLRKKYMEGVDAIVVYSKIDESDERPKGAFENVKSALGIKDEKHLVFTGDGSPEYIEAWRKDIDAVISESEAWQKNWRRKQLLQLNVMLSEEMGDVLSDLGDLISDNESSDDSSRTFSNMSKCFDASKIELREYFETMLGEILSNRVSEAIDKANAKYTERETGFLQPIRRTVRDYLFDENGKEESVNNILEESWNETYDAFNRSYLDRITDLTLTQLHIMNARKVNGDRKEDDISGWFSYPERKASDSLSSEIDDNVLKNIHMLFYDLDAVKTAEQDECFERTIELLPALALEFSRLNTVQSFRMQRIKLSGSTVGFPEGFEHNTNEGKKVIRAIGYMLAIDACADGKIDTIPALLNLITGGAGAAGAAVTANPYVLAAVGLYAIGTMGITIKQAIREGHGRSRQSLSSGIAALGAKQKTVFLNHYDKMMKELWKSIETRYRQRHKIAGKMGQVEEARHLINLLDYQKRTLLGAIHASTALL